jgi:hypothetical protein
MVAPRRQRKAGHGWGQERSASAASAANVIKRRRLKRLMPLAIGRRPDFGRVPYQGAVGVFGTKPKGCKA